MGNFDNQDRDSGEGRRSFGNNRGGSSGGRFGNNRGGSRFGGNRNSSGRSRFGNNRGGSSGGRFGNNRGGSRFGGGSRFNNGPREMHKAVCSECKQECEVPFKPTEGRPVLCSECFKKQKGF